MKKTISILLFVLIAIFTYGCENDVKSQATAESQMVEDEPIDLGSGITPDDFKNAVNSTVTNQEAIPDFETKESSSGYTFSYTSGKNDRDMTYRYEGTADRNGNVTSFTLSVDNADLMDLSMYDVVYKSLLNNDGSDLQNDIVTIEENVSGILAALGIEDGDKMKTMNMLSNDKPINENGWKVYSNVAEEFPDFSDIVNGNVDTSKWSGKSISNKGTLVVKAMYQG